MQETDSMALHIYLYNFSLTLIKCKQSIVYIINLKCMSNNTNVDE